MPLEVIGVGIGRTGTYSLKHALQELGLPCYHYADAVLNPSDFGKWEDCTEAVLSGKTYDFDRIYSQPDRPAYRAAVDTPSMCFYKELLQAYPKAKFILTVRDNPEVWYVSYYNTVFEATKGDPVLNLLVPLLAPWIVKSDRIIKKLVWDSPRLFDGKFGKDKEYVKQQYLAWAEEVKRTIPPSQLLEFNVKQGWAPLCKFLGVPVPDLPFPRMNDTEEFNKRMEQMRRMAWGVVLGAGAAAGLLAGVAVYVLKRQRSK
jgi:hypothetical protein